MQTLSRFYDFVNEITRQNGSKYKTAILQKYKDDEDVKYYLNFLYNFKITTGIALKKLQKNFGDKTFPVVNIDTVKGMLEYIIQNNTGSDAVIYNVQNFRDNILRKDYEDDSEDFKNFLLCDLLNSLVTKNLQLGIDVTTINKVIPNFLPEFNVMLAEKYFEDPQRIIGHEFAITTKIDGGRIIAIKENGEVTFYTRQGQLYEGLIDLEDEMKQFMPDNICLDGEITLLSPYESVYDLITDETTQVKIPSKDQYKKTMEIVRADGEKHGVKMLVFDFMTAEDFRNQKCEKSYFTRRECLDEIFYGFDEAENHKFKYFNLLPLLYHGNDTAVIRTMLDEQIANGEEGIMLNYLDAPYSFSRTWNLQKVKKMHDIDLRVVGFEEGKGRNKGRLGAFVVSYKGNTVNVGNMPDNIREKAWANQSEWLGKIISVQYFEETHDKKGNLSLRFPVFLDLRTDKTTPDFE